jgi:hypothetical protein
MHLLTLCQLSMNNELVVCLDEGFVDDSSRWSQVEKENVDLKRPSHKL